MSTFSELILGCRGPVYITKDQKLLECVVADVTQVPVAVGRGAFQPHGRGVGGGVDNPPA